MLAKGKKKNTAEIFCLHNSTLPPPRRVTLCPFDFFVTPSIMQSTLSMRSVVSQRASARARERAEAPIMSSRREKEKKAAPFSSSSSSALSLLISAPLGLRRFPPRIPRPTLSSRTKTQHHSQKTQRMTAPVRRTVSNSTRYFLFSRRKRERKEARERERRRDCSLREEEEREKKSKRAIKDPHLPCQF